MQFAGHHVLKQNVLICRGADDPAVRERLRDREVGEGKALAAEIEYILGAGASLEVSDHAPTPIITVEDKAIVARTACHRVATYQSAATGNQDVVAIAASQIIAAVADQRIGASAAE